MVGFFQRHGKRSSRPLRAKFWDSLVTGTSAPRPLANVPVTRLPRFGHNLVTGTLFWCPKSVPVTSIYCTINTRYGHTLYRPNQVTGIESRVPTFLRQIIFVIGTSTPRYRHTKKPFCAWNELWRQKLCWRDITKWKRMCEVKIRNPQPQARGNQQVFPGSGYLSGC